MCGIAGIFGKDWTTEQLVFMQMTQNHRGPDDEGIYINLSRTAGLAHNRLSIIDLSEAGRQPMKSGDLYIIFNGEIYNYLELKKELESEFEFKTQTDTEVLLAAYRKWGTAFLDRLIGMFSFIIWDERGKTAFAARDRFGVKPLYYHKKSDGTLILASEIKAIHSAGIPRDANEKAWANYLAFGLYDHTDETFWKNVYALPAGHKLVWKNNQTQISRWYDIAEKIGDEVDARSENEVGEEYFALMKESVKLRFRSDVPVGINLSGGLDSSSLLGLVQEVQGADSDAKAFTFTTGDKNYDELPWVREMLLKTNHELVESRLSPKEVPALAEKIGKFQDEPFGGIPTLAYAKLFQTARESGVKVLLDGNGMDEQWAGYDYYKTALNGNGSQPNLIQGTKEKAVRPECLTKDFYSKAEPFVFPQPFADKVKNLQYRDVRFTKIPRAMRFNDRISMCFSTELREPFLDHRLFEIALRQPVERKILNGTHKKMLREISKKLLPGKLTESPKRALQTPQREWLRGELKDWADEKIKAAVTGKFADWFDEKSVIDAWQKYKRGAGDNSFYIWQWIDLGIRSAQ